MKQTLKELAGVLPEKYKAHMYENQLVIAHQQNPLMYAIMEPHESDIQNSRGILTLLQSIEEKGWIWQTGVTTKRNGQICYYCKATKEPFSTQSVSCGNCSTIAEAVAKAALEVHKR